MSENQNRRRYRNNNNKKRDEARRVASPSAPVTIAKREDTPRAVSSATVQPKILLKKEQESTEPPTAIKTIIINRSDATTLPKEKDKEKDKEQDKDKDVPLHMTRATSLLLSNGVFNANAKKMFHKSNTDFRVIGVLGAQSVGKSTLLNLLAAAEQGEDYDYYEHLISEADACIFRTRQRTKDKGKSVLRPRTDTLQFFITRERYVLLDTPPLEQLNQHSLNTIFQLLSVCHVVIIALDGLNMEQLRLLHAALRLRPSQGLAGKNLPQLLFVRTRALSEHYQPAWRERLEQQLSLLFGEFVTGEINCLLLPQLRSNAECVHHCGLPQLVRELWDFILGLPRLSSSDLSELQWFELLAETMRKCQFSSQHFDSVFTEIKQQQLEPRQKRANWRAET